MIRLWMLLSIASLYGQPDEPPEPPESDEPRPVALGDAPPPLKVGAWINGRPPALPGSAIDGQERAFLVYFGSPAEDAWLDDVARLAQIHAAFTARGVVVLVVSNDEPHVLAGFAQGPPRVPLIIGHDSDNSTTEAWMAGIDEFPWTCVIDRGGRLAWAGKSIWEARDAIADIVADKLDAAAIRKAVETAKQIEMLDGMMANARRQGDPKTVLNLLDKVIAADPTRADSYEQKRRWLIRLGRIEALTEVNEAMRAACWDRPAALHALLESQWRSPQPTARDLRLMARCACRLVELTDGDDPFAWAELARVRGELGQFDAAIDAQQRAVDLIKLDIDEAMSQSLEYYRRLKAAAAEIDPRNPAVGRPPNGPTPASNESPTSRAAREPGPDKPLID